MELTGSRVNNRRRYVGMGPDDRNVMGHAAYDPRAFEVLALG